MNKMQAAQIAINRMKETITPYNNMSFARAFVTEALECNIKLYPVYKYYHQSIEDLERKLEKRLSRDIKHYKQIYDILFTLDEYRALERKILFEMIYKEDYNNGNLYV